MTNIEFKSPLPLFAQSVRKARPYAGVMVFVLFAFVYGYMIFKINALANPTLDESTVSASVSKLPKPRIDDNAAKQLLSLKDNSEAVQTLFQQGRTNPFQE